MCKKNQNIIELLSHTANNMGEEEKISLDQISMIMRDRGFSFLVFLFALPMSIPIPTPPGVNTLFSIPLLIFSTQKMFGMRKPRLPSWIGAKKIKRSFINKLFKKIIPCMMILNRFSKERLFFILYMFGSRIYGLIIFIFSLSIALPIPFSNLIPAIGLVIMSVADINRDGLLFLVGILVGAVGIVITALVVLFGYKALSIASIVK